MNNYNKAEIINYIKRNKGAEIPGLQLKYGVSYNETKKIIDELVAKGELVYAYGLKYDYLDKPAFMPKAQRTKIELFQPNEEYIGDDDDDDEDYDGMLDAKIDEYLSYLDNTKNKGSAEDGETDGEEDDYLIVREEEGIGGAKLKETIDILKTLITKNSKIPVRIIDDFARDFAERLAALIASDKEMDRNGAIKKAQRALDTARKTDDAKTAAVYARIVRELQEMADDYYNIIRVTLF